MTAEEATALGKRLVACKGFRPMRGMLDMQGRTWDTSLLWRWNSTVDVPDLRDAATRGCALQLLREAWRCPTAYVRQSTGRRASDNLPAWEVEDLWLDAQACAMLGTTREGSVRCWGFSCEEEALVGGLESAP